jgi:hypothetical protein
VVAGHLRSPRIWGRSASTAGRSRSFLRWTRAGNRKGHNQYRRNQPDGFTGCSHVVQPGCLPLSAQRLNAQPRAAREPVCAEPKPMSDARPLQRFDGRPLPNPREESRRSRYRDDFPHCLLAIDRRLDMVSKSLRGLPDRFVPAQSGLIPEMSPAVSTAPMIRRTTSSAIRGES